MANFSLTSYLKLKKVKPGERDWAKEERSNWDIVDQFANWIADQINTITGGSITIPAPIFNNTFTTLEVKGILDPSAAVYSWDTNGKVIQGIETFSDLGLTKTSQYAYRTDGKLDTITSDFDGVIRVERFIYGPKGELLSIEVTETPNGSL